MFQVGICVDRNDPKDLRRIKIRTDAIQDKTDWVLPLMGGWVNMPVPEKHDQVMLFYDNEHYDNLFYMPMPTKQFSGSNVGDRQEKLEGVKNSFEVDLPNNTSLALDGEAKTAQLEALNVTVGAESDSEYIVMSKKLKDWITGAINAAIEDHDHATGTGPSGSAKTGPTLSATPLEYPSEADLASIRHKVGDEPI